MQQNPQLQHFGPQSKEAESTEYSCFAVIYGVQNFSLWWGPPLAQIHIVMHPRRSFTGVYSGFGPPAPKLCKLL